MEGDEEEGRLLFKICLLLRYGETRVCQGGLTLAMSSQSVAVAHAEGLFPTSESEKDVPKPWGRA